MSEVTPRRPKLYLETTIVSYLGARPSRDVIILAHQELTRKWWAEERQRYETFISPFVIEEASQGYPVAAAQRLHILSGIPPLAPREEVQSLASLVRHAAGLPSSAHGDALHLSYAIYYELDYLLTWNCAHLASRITLRRLADFTRNEDLWLPIVCTPEEMATQRKAEDHVEGPDR